MSPSLVSLVIAPAGVIRFLNTPSGTGESSLVVAIHGIVFDRIVVVFVAGASRLGSSIHGQRIDSCIMSCRTVHRHEMLLPLEGVMLI